VGCWVDLEMIRYISLLLLIGLAFWGCEDATEPSLIGTWEYVNYEVTIIELPDSSNANLIDSITTAEHQYRIDMNLTFTFTEDSITGYDSSPISYNISNDTIYTEWMYMMLGELNENELTINMGGYIRTDSTGDLLYQYGQLWFFDRQ